jgi:hypothetical protein
MLAFTNISTGATANEGFNIDEVNNRFAEPAVALTATGADIETGRAHLKMSVPAVAQTGSTSLHQI